MIDPAALVSSVASGVVAVAAACRRPEAVAESAWRVHLVERHAKVAGRLAGRLRKAERARVDGAG